MTTFADPKIAALGNAAMRAANRSGDLSFARPMDERVQRFVTLWKARNRRVRVQMRKLRRASGDLAW